MDAVLSIELYSFPSRGCAGVVKNVQHALCLDGDESAELTAAAFRCEAAGGAVDSGADVHRKAPDDCFAGIIRKARTFEDKIIAENRSTRFVVMAMTVRVASDSGGVYEWTLRDRNMDRAAFVPEGSFRLIGQRGGDA